MSNMKHGHSGRGASTGTYRSWEHMHQRCRNPNQYGYENYGGRGISVDPRWNDFAVFLKDMGERPIGGSIDRIDNNKDYGPGNCRWVPARLQARHKRNTKTNRPVTWNGVTRTIAEWADEFGYSTRQMQEAMEHCNFDMDEALDDLPPAARVRTNLGTPDSSGASESAARHATDCFYT